ncbi:MAG TPA: adenosylcobinamide amidohydrolase, partial [Fibrobacteraceae bacterium]|nr:adenosylcobinamide amidohydrolase [Fibrobacteraceae bacterium]
GRRFWYRAVLNPMSPLIDAPNFSIERGLRYLCVRFKDAHQVLSTCSINGGLRNDLAFLLNSQTCEGSSQHPRTRNLHLLSREDLHRQSCEDAGLDPHRTAVLGTAANMDYAALRESSYEDAQVTAVVTAGVEGNAGRAGDPAQWHESDEGYRPAHSVPGTINIILLFHQSLSHAALARSVVTLTEAKSAALQDLAIGSRYSCGLATGTGTDQYAVASPFAEKARFHWTGNHAKLGELVGCAVHDAVLEALRWQNGLEISVTRGLFHILRRFGVDEAVFRTTVEQVVEDAAQRAFLLDSLPMLTNDPKVSACACAIAAILDRRNIGALSTTSVQEAVVWQSALCAVSISGHPERLEVYRASIAALPDPSPINTVAKAVELGWRDKWEGGMPDPIPR